MRDGVKVGRDAASVTSDAAKRKAAERARRYRARRKRAERKAAMTTTASGATGNFPNDFEKSL
jgi:hypothetical protein